MNSNHSHGQAIALTQNNMWLSRLQDMKETFIHQYEKAPRRSAMRPKIYNDFCVALALYYGLEPNAPDIIAEVDMELLFVDRRKHIDELYKMRA